MNKLHLFRYVKRYIVLYVIAFLAMSAGTMLDQAAPLIVQHIIDDVLIAQKTELLKAAGILFLFITDIITDSVKAMILKKSIIITDNSMKMNSALLKSSEKRLFRNILYKYKMSLSWTLNKSYTVFQGLC